MDFMSRIVKGSNVGCLGWLLPIGEYPELRMLEDLARAVDFCVAYFLSHIGIEGLLLRCRGEKKGLCI